MAGLKRNLSTGFALLTLRRRWPPRLAVSFEQLAALVILNLAVWAVLDALHAQEDAPLSLDGLFGWACYLLLGLAACALVARLQARAADTRALLVALLSVAPLVLILLWLAGDLTWVRAHPRLMTLTGLAYLLVLGMRVLGAAYGVVRLRARVAALVLLLASPWVLVSLNLDTRLWVAEDTAQDRSDEDSGQTEALFYDQPARIAAAVARVRPAQRGRTGVYFVGFAGDGNPAVFRHEALFASAAFAGRFGSKERSVLLINDVEDRDSYPLASVAGLGQTLKVMASRMDTDNDVLVLFLTSHGSRDGLEVQNGALPLAPLAPADLHEALEASGIRWRVLVVSACYAGVFIDELKSDTTAILTASDADHSSFGCQEDRNLTWFGEAFLKDSLPGSDSLEDAFNKAKKLIVQREDAEHEVHSNPQLSLGAAMKRKLAELDLARPQRDRHSFTVAR